MPAYCLGSFERALRGVSWCRHCRQPVLVDYVTGLVEAHVPKQRRAKHRKTYIEHADTLVDVTDTLA